VFTSGVKRISYGLMSLVTVRVNGSL